MGKTLEPPIYDTTEPDGKLDRPLIDGEPPPPFDAVQGGAEGQMATESGRVDIDLDKLDGKTLAQLEEVTKQLPETELQRALSKSINIPGPLNVVVHVVGSRGDVQAFIALGLVLKNQYAIACGWQLTARSRLLLRIMASSSSILAGIQRS